MSRVTSDLPTFLPDHLRVRVGYVVNVTYYNNSVDDVGRQQRKKRAPWVTFARSRSTPPEFLCWTKATRASWALPSTFRHPQEVPCRRIVQRRNHEIYFGYVSPVFSRPFRFCIFHLPSFPFPFLSSTSKWLLKCLRPLDVPEQPEDCFTETVPRRRSSAGRSWFGLCELAVGPSMYSCASCHDQNIVAFKSLTLERCIRHLSWFSIFDFIKNVKYARYTKFIDL